MITAQENFSYIHYGVLSLHSSFSISFIPSMTTSQTDDVCEHREGYWTDMRQRFAFQTDSNASKIFEFKNRKTARFEIFPAIKIQVVIFWDITKKRHNTEDCDLNRKIVFFCNDISSFHTLYRVKWEDQVFTDRHILENISSTIPCIRW